MSQDKEHIPEELRTILFLLYHAGWKAHEASLDSRNAAGLRRLVDEAVEDAARAIATWHIAELEKARAGYGPDSKKYPYKARKNALFSIQLHEGNGSIDLKVVSNMSDETDQLFPNPKYDFDAVRHGRYAAESINQFADGRALAFLKRFVGALHGKLNGARAVDLNDPQYFLSTVEDPIEKFNLFIKKWCPDYAHLIDSDQNDGQEMRDMLARLAKDTQSNGGEDDGVQHLTMQIMRDLDKLLHKHGLQQRLEELKNVQLDHGNYVTQTFVDGKAMSIEERIAAIQAELKEIATDENT